MRDIKFRAWFRKNNGFMMYSGFSVNPNGIIFNIHNEKQDAVLMQYTGLEDKNGVRIYEGDLIKAIKYENILQDEISQVVFRSGAFQLQTIEFEYNAMLSLCNIKMRNIEVVGNIYENKELLGERDEAGV